MEYNKAKKITNHLKKEVEKMDNVKKVDAILTGATEEDLHILLTVSIDLDTHEEYQNYLKTIKEIYKKFNLANIDKPEEHETYIYYVIGFKGVK